MQYKILHNKQIDKALWDACVLQSDRADVYALSWYLDIESPEWKGLVVGDYQAVFPFPIEKIFGVFKRIRTNFLTKDFSIYRNNNFEKSNIDAIISKAIAQYFFVIFNLSKDIVLSKKFKVAIKRKQYIDFQDIGTYPGKNLRKSLRDAEAQHFEVRHDIPLQLAMDFLQKELSYKHNLKEGFFYKNLSALIEASSQRNIGFVSGLYHNNALCAVDFYAKVNDKLFLIQNAGNEQSKVGGMPFLLYQIIERFRHSIRYVDFMGSNLPNIISFNKNFCNKDIEYLLITKG